MTTRKWWLQDTDGLIIRPPQDNPKVDGKKKGGGTGGSGGGGGSKGRGGPTQGGPGKGGGRGNSGGGASDAYLLVAINASPGYEAWDSSDWSAVSFGTNPAQLVRCIRGDPNGNKFAIGMNNAPFFTIRDMTGAVQVTLAGVGNDGIQLAYNSNGSLLMGSYLESFVQKKCLFDPSDGTQVGTEATVGNHGPMTWFANDQLVMCTGTSTSSTWNYTYADTGVSPAYTLDQFVTGAFNDVNTASVDYDSNTGNVLQMSSGTPYLVVFLNPDHPTNAASTQTLSLSSAPDNTWGLRNCRFSNDGSEIFVTWNVAKTVLGSSVTMGAISTSTWDWSRVNSVTHAFDFQAMDVSPDGTKIACVYGGTNLVVYNTSDFSVLHTATLTAAVNDISWTPKV